MNRAAEVILSVVLTAAGVMIAALGDFSFDLVGYSMAFTSVFFQTMYLVLVEKSGAEDGLSSVEIMFYNSFLSLPFLVFLIIATGEFPDSLSLLFAKVDNLEFLREMRINPIKVAKALVEVFAEMILMNMGARCYASSLIEWRNTRARKLMRRLASSGLYFFHNRTFFKFLVVITFTCSSNFETQIECSIKL
ncbi:UDP-galactose/UDP-glucose transporter 7-like [Camellia sinensis]|uniref:UDP-galactose/UDP-glucose transporter 7-like n=1 Tax=Camellia sinensis TaxID=4442 RepID=UPI001035CEFD|nr:UDP-galactose/UDP-glucose transporter 7-like [Camellia sinensis]